MKRPSDFQRSAVYKWEGQFFGNIKHLNEPMTLDQIRAWVKAICKQVKLKTPEVSDGRSRRRACYELSAHCIKLPVWSRKPWVVIHELAHAVVHCKHNAKNGFAANHGAIFVGMYLGLAHQFLGIDFDISTASAIAEGLRVNEEAGQTIIRKTKNLPIVTIPVR